MVLVILTKWQAGWPCFHPVLRIRITLMRIQILLVTLMRIRVLITKWWGSGSQFPKQRLKTLKKCSNKLIFHPYILAFHLHIDADPDPAITLTRLRINLLIWCRSMRIRIRNTAFTSAYVNEEGDVVWTLITGTDECIILLNGGGLHSLTCVHPLVNEKGAGVSEPLGAVLTGKLLEVGIVEPLVRCQTLSWNKNCKWNVQDRIVKKLAGRCAKKALRKGTVSRDFFQVFFMNHLPPSPWK